MKLLVSNKFERFLPYTVLLIGLMGSLATLCVHPLWFDEHLTMNEAQSRSLKDMMALVLRHESIPPLFFILEYFMVKLFSLSVFTLRNSSCFGRYLRKLFLLENIYKSNR
jgi:hypothetical protein